MGLHRLFWIPHGAAPTDGVYVHYRADELYAIVCLESHRHRARIVGENLGTVPSSVNAAMSRHGLAQLYVAQFGVTSQGPHPLRRVPRRAFACLNTHDTPTFAGFLEGRDIEDRVARGVLDVDQEGLERQRRQGEVATLHRLGAPEPASPRIGLLWRSSGPVSTGWDAAPPASSSSIWRICGWNRGRGTCRVRAPSVTTGVARLATPSRP